MQHVGFGKTARLKRVEIDWPGAKAPQVLAGVPVDSWIEATQGEPGFKKLTRRRFRLGGSAAASAR
jgi:hypothetical protein